MSDTPEEFADKFIGLLRAYAAGIAMSIYTQHAQACEPFDEVMEELHASIAEGEKWMRNTLIAICKQNNITLPDTTDSQ